MEWKRIKFKTTNVLSTTVKISPEYRLRIHFEKRWRRIAKIPPMISWRLISTHYLCPSVITTDSRNLHDNISPNKRREAKEKKETSHSSLHHILLSLRFVGIEIRILCKSELFLKKTFIHFNKI